MVDYSSYEGSVGDILVKVSSSFADADTSSTYSDYEAIEKAEFSFSTVTGAGFTLEDNLIVQKTIGSSEQKYSSVDHTSAAPSGIYDVGVTNADMIAGSSSSEILHFVIDSSKVTADFDLQISGVYEFTDYGADNTNGGGDDTALAAILDPFIFTVDIA